MQQTWSQPPLEQASVTPRTAAAPPGDARTPPMLDPTEAHEPPVEVARDATKAPAGHAQLRVAAPTQADAPPTSSESPVTPAQAGNGTVDGEAISPPTQAPASPALEPTPTVLAPVALPPAAILPADKTASRLPPLAAPVSQLAPALVSLRHSPDGTQRLTMRLDPPELGHLQLRIDRPLDAPARVEITVEKAETLTLVLRDQPQLQRALDQAGVPPEGRSITFHVASPDPVPRNDPGTVPTPGVATGGPSGDGSHGAHRQAGHPRQEQASMQDGGGPLFSPTAWMGWVRGGLDITA